MKKSRPKAALRCFLCFWLASMLCSLLLQFAHADDPAPKDCVDCRSKKQEPATVNSSDADTTSKIKDALSEANGSDTPTTKTPEPIYRITVNAAHVFSHEGRLIGGQLHKSPPCAKDLSIVCGTFSSGNKCKSFWNNRYANDLGSVSISNPQTISAEQAKEHHSSKDKNHYSASSDVQRDAKLALDLKPLEKQASDQYEHSDVSGYLDLPQSFFKRNNYKDGALPNYIGAAFDLKLNKKTRQLEGGILLYTSKDDQGCFKGDFISL